jgi:hypothetical protein
MFDAKQTLVDSKLTSGEKKDIQSQAAPTFLVIC